MAADKPVPVWRGNANDQMTTNTYSRGAITPYLSGEVGREGDTSLKCIFCKEQKLHCGGKPPIACSECSRRQLPCHYKAGAKAQDGKNLQVRLDRGGKKRAAAEETGAASKKQRMLHLPQQDGSITFITLDVAPSKWRL